MFPLYKTLPEEIQQKILNKLSISGLGRVARVSQDEKRISEDDIIWKERLIKDFHFASQSAGDLKTRINKNYKRIYQYCVEYKLNYAQRSALSELQGCGLTANHLRGCDWFCTTEHINALTYLMLKRNFTADQAMAELDGLSSWEQAEGISHGLTRTDVMGLMGVQIRALVQLRDQGLTANHLRGCDWFCTTEHTNALTYLILKRNFTADQAMAELDGLLSWEQAQDISHGKTREDIIGNRSSTFKK